MMKKYLLTVFFFFSLTTKRKLNEKLPRETKTLMKVITLGLIIKFFSSTCVHQRNHYQVHYILLLISSPFCFRVEAGHGRYRLSLSESLVFLPAKLSGQSQSLVGTHHFSHSCLYFHSHMEPNVKCDCGVSTVSEQRAETHGRLKFSKDRAGF